MARQTISGRRRRTGGNSGYVKCNMCHGTGRVRRGNRSGRSRTGGGGSRG